MAIFDVDSLVGINENKSYSGMGESSSYSVTNNRLWQQVVIQTSNSELGDPNGKGHKWVIIITKHKFIMEQFKKLTGFPQSQAEIDEQNENMLDRTCVNCDLPFNTRRTKTKNY